MTNEFKKITGVNETHYVLETASGGATSSGSIASAPGGVGKVQKRGNLLAQEEKKETPKPRNFVAKNAKMGGAGQHKDKKKAEKQGDVKHRKPFSEQGVAEGYTPSAGELARDLIKLADADFNEKYGMSKQQANQHYSSNKLKEQGVAEATGDEKFDTMMSRMQKEPTIPDTQMPPTDVKDLYQWAVKNNKPYHKIFAEWANRQGYKSVAPALQKAGNLDTDALDYWTPEVWKIYWGEVRGIDSEMPRHWSKERVPDELRDYLETVFDAYENIWQDWPTEYRQIGQKGVAEAEKKGLYYYVNKRKKAGTSRDASSPKAPSAQSWKDAAKTAKKESVAEGWGYGDGYDKGFSDGYDGQRKHNPFPPGSKEHKEYDEGWFEGRLDYQKMNRDLDEQGVAEDHEIQMASSELQSIAKNSQALLHMVRKYSEQEGLDAWQQSKITKAADYLNAVLQSISGEQNPLEGVGVPSYGVGGYRNRGDDERHDLDVPKQDPKEIMMYNLIIDGKPLNPKPILGRSNLIKWGRQQAATGVDLSNAVISPVRYEESSDPYFESLTNKLDQLKKK